LQNTSKGRPCIYT